MSAYACWQWPVGNSFLALINFAHRPPAKGQSKMSDDLGNKSSSDDLKKKILSSMNTTFTGDPTNRWITAMKDEAFDEVEEAVAPATESSKLNHSMAAVIDRLFDNFKRYSFEYNR